MPTRNASGDAQLDWLGPSVANMLRTEVGQSAALRTVSGDRVTQILTDMRIAADTSLDPATITRAARFGSADTALWGQYVKFGSEIRIDATLQDLTSERTVALKAQATNEADLPAAIQRLANRFARACLCRRTSSRSSPPAHSSHRRVRCRRCAITRKASS